jgi:hypothetical protein
MKDTIKAIESGIKIGLMIIMAVCLPSACTNLQFISNSLTKIAYNPVCTGDRP